MGYRLGRWEDGRLKHVCNVASRSDGGITLTDITAMTDSERQALYSHFGTPLRAAEGYYVGGVDGTAIKSHAPGTPAHFDNAVHQLPQPFYLMGEAK